jgi:di/tricarboxylate transporter
MPELPSPHALAAILIALLAIFLYTRERLPLESTSFFILCVIVLWFEIYSIEYDGERIRAGNFLAGFGNDALIAVVSLMVLARSLEVTNALHPIGRVLAGLWRSRPKLAFLVTMLIAAVLSMFLNNTPVVAAIMPLLVAVSLQAKISTSGILMPIGFATIIGGMSTTIGTSTNLLVVSVAADFGMREMQMFDFALPVLITGSVGIAYLWLVAPRLIPERSPPLTDIAPRIFESRLRINPGAAADGKTLAELFALAKGQMRVNQVSRGELSLARLPSVAIKAGDYLHVNDTLENLKEYERLFGATLLTVDTEEQVNVEHPLASEQHIAEVVVTEGSALEQRTLESSRLLSSFGLTLLALHRQGRGSGDSGRSVTDTMLRAGDVILVQGLSKGLDRLKRSGQALVLDGNIDLPRPANASLALLIMAGVVVVAGTGLMRISQTAVIGVALMLATRCLTWNDVRGALDRRIILVIVASLALGLALMATGAAEYIAQLYVAATYGLPVAVILSGLILIMALLTEVATNNAIAVLGTPIAISIAQVLGAPVEPFVLGVLYGANMSYLTPVGYQTNLLVMSAGGYQFTDFLRAGIPLQLIMWIGLSIVLPIMYDL